MISNIPLLYPLPVAAILLAATLPTTLPAAWEASDLGETAVFQMENAPFPHASRADGYTYKDKLLSAEEHYSDNSVAIFLPEAFDGSERVNILYYFHGWGNSVDKAMDEFRLREQVAASGRNIALVFPEGPKNASDSGLGKLEDEGGLARLNAEVLETLRSEKKVGVEAKCGDVVLSGHSGAYRGIAYSLHHGGLNEFVSEVYLLDASYSNTDYFVEWMTGGENRRFLSIFTDHLAADNTWMMAQLSQANEPFVVRVDGEYTPEDLAENQRIFVYTQKRDHNGAVGILEDFLKSGAPR